MSKKEDKSEYPSKYISHGNYLTKLKLLKVGYPKSLKYKKGSVEGKVSPHIKRNPKCFS